MGAQLHRYRWCSKRKFQEQMDNKMKQTSKDFEKENDFMWID